MTGRVLLAWYGYLAITPQNHLRNVTVTGLARSSLQYDCTKGNEMKAPGATRKRLAPSFIRGNEKRLEQHEAKK